MKSELQHTRRKEELQESQRTAQSSERNVIGFVGLLVCTARDGGLTPRRYGGQDGDVACAWLVESRLAVGNRHYGGGVVTRRAGYGLMEFYN